MKKCILTWLCLTAITLNGLTYNIVCHNGGTYLIANHYNNPINNSLTYVFAGVPDFSTVIIWNCSARYDTYFADSASPSGWDDRLGNPLSLTDIASITLAPGQGAFFIPSGDCTLNFTGSSGHPVPAALPCGYWHWNLLSKTTDPGPSSSTTYSDVTGQNPPELGARVSRWNGSGFTTYTYACDHSNPSQNKWYPTEPILAQGESAFFSVPNPATPLPSGSVLIFIEGPAVTAPGRAFGYFLDVINLGCSSSPAGTVKLTVTPTSIFSSTGTPILTPPSTYKYSHVLDFTVDVPAITPDESVSYFFEVACGTLIDKDSFTMDASSTDIIPSTPGTLTVTVVNSLDPNDKYGPTGTGTNHCLTGNPVLPYCITFENDPGASGPAQRVVITEQLDPGKMDLDSFQFTGITFGSKVVTPILGANPYSFTVLSYNVGGNIVDVQIDAALDLNFFSQTYGRVTWTFQTLDPVTHEPPIPSIGFLPPNTTPPQGQGMVTFTVNTLPNLVAGDLITNSASIVFDSNGAIPTGIWTNTIVGITPALTIAKAAAGQVTITWPSWVLQEAGSLTGPWTNSAVQVSPWTFIPSESTKFYRLQAP